VVSVVAGVWMLLHRTGIVSVSGDAVNVFGSGFVALARRVAPALPLYAGAAALLVSALGIWWWAERDAAL
jgi:collagenase-like PrtC family protease